MANAETCIVCDGTKVFRGEPCSYCDCTGYKLEDAKYPTCPYCGYANEDYWEAVSLRDGEEQVVSCGSCGADYTVTVNIEYSFTSTKEVAK